MNHKSSAHKTTRRGPLTRRDLDFSWRKNAKQVAQLLQVGIVLTHTHEGIIGQIDIVGDDAGSLDARRRGGTAEQAPWPRLAQNGRRIEGAGIYHGPAVERLHCESARGSDNDGHHNLLKSFELAGSRDRAD